MKKDRYLRLSLCTRTDTGIQACYRSPGDPTAIRIHCGGGLTAISGRGHEIHVEHDANLAAQEIEQDGDTLTFSQSFKETKAVHESPGKNSHFVAWRKGRAAIEHNKTLVVLARLEGADHSCRDRGRPIA